MAGVWGLPAHGPLGPPWKHSTEVRTVALGLVGVQPTLAAGCIDGTLHLGAAVEPELGTVLPHPSTVTSVEFGDADGRIMLATACGDGNIRLWDPVQPSAPRFKVDAHIGSVALVPGADGTLDVVAGDDRSGLQWWSGEDGQRLFRVDVADRRPVRMGKWAQSPTVTVAAGHVDGRHIALTSCLGMVQLLELGGPARAARVIREHGSEERTWRPTALHVGDGQALFATADGSRATRVYDAFTGLPVGPRLPWDSDSSVLGFHRSRGRTWLAVTDDRGLTLFDVEYGTPLGPPVEVYPGERPIALGMLEGEEVLAILGSGQLRLCDVTTGKDRIPPIRTSRTARAVAFARLGQRDVVLTAHFATIRIWNPFTGRQLTELPFGTSIAAMAVHSSPDGTVRVAVGGPGLLFTELRDGPAQIT
jgi:WD40 repeat protein